MTIADFDGVVYHVSTPVSKSKILISLSMKCFGQLKEHGALEVLKREYGNLVAPVENGYDFSVEVDQDNLPPNIGKLFLNRRAILGMGPRQWFALGAEFYQNGITPQNKKKRRKKRMKMNEFFF
jgi:hypothetical protein